MAIPTGRHNSYKYYCSLVRRLLRAAKCDYYNNQFRSPGKDPKKTGRSFICWEKANPI